MTASEKIKTIANKSSKIKLSTMQIDKHLRVQLYHQELLINMNLKMFYTKKLVQSKDLNTHH